MTLEATEVGVADWERSGVGGKMVVSEVDWAIDMAAVKWRRRTSWWWAE